MSLSCRRFVVARDDSLYRLTNVGLWRMLHEPQRYQVPELADQRVRAAEAVVELAGGTPTFLARCTFSVLTFDSAGHLDRARLMQQQAARFEAAFAPVLDRSRDRGGVVDAASQFLAQGGVWHPSEQIRERIEAAALGRVNCPRLRVVAK